MLSLADTRRLRDKIMGSLADRRTACSGDVLAGVPDFAAYSHQIGAHAAYVEAERVVAAEFRRFLEEDEDSTDA